MDDYSKRLDPGSSHPTKPLRALAETPTARDDAVLGSGGGISAAADHGDVAVEVGEAATVVEMAGGRIVAVHFQFGLKAFLAGDLQGLLQQKPANAPVLQGWFHRHVVDIEATEVVAQPGRSGQFFILPGQQHDAAVVQIVAHRGQVVHAGRIADASANPDAGNTLKERLIQRPGAGDGGQMAPLGGSSPTLALKSGACRVKRNTVSKITSKYISGWLSTVIR